MKHRYEGCDNKSVIAPECDNTFQPIRIQYCRHVSILILRLILDIVPPSQLVSYILFIQRLCTSTLENHLSSRVINYFVNHKRLSFHAFQSDNSLVINYYECHITLPLFYEHCSTKGSDIPVVY